MKLIKQKNRELERKNKELEQKNKELEQQNRDSQCDLSAAQHNIHSLENEIDRLAGLISDKTDDCCVGSWCYDCQYFGVSSTDYLSYSRRFDRMGTYQRQVGKSVQYCRKHISTICPDFKTIEKEES